LSNPSVGAFEMMFSPTKGGNYNTECHLGQLDG